MVKLRVLAPARRHFDRAVLLFASRDSTPGHCHHAFIVELPVIAVEVLLDRILIVLFRINSMPIHIEHMLSSAYAAIEPDVCGFSPAILQRRRPKLLVLVNARVVNWVVRRGQGRVLRKRG